MLKGLLAAGALALAAGNVDAATLTLDFDGVGDDAPIDQSYGDVEGKVDISYGSFDPNNPSITGGVFGYQNGYETLTGVAYASESHVMEILFGALTGFGVSISGFDIANFADRGFQTSIRILDLITDEELYDSGSRVPTEDCGPEQICRFTGLTVESSNGLRLLFGPDAYYTGIDNISYNTYETNGPSPIPLPASAWMLLAAVGGMGAVARRKRTAP